MQYLFIVFTKIQWLMTRFPLRAYALKGNFFSIVLKKQFKFVFLKKILILSFKKITYEIFLFLPFFLVKKNNNNVHFSF